MGEGLAGGGGGGGARLVCGYVLRGRHAPALLQVRPGAETLVDLAREHQRPRPRPDRPALPPTGPPAPGLPPHGVDLARELGEERARDGVAGARVVEAEDADVAEVGGGDVVGFYEGGGGGGGGAGGAEGRFGGGEGVVVEDEGGMSGTHG